MGEGDAVQIRDADKNARPGAWAGLSRQVIRHVSGRDLSGTGHHFFPSPRTLSALRGEDGNPSQEATMIDLRPCHQCGTLLTPALADAVNNPAAPETCPAA